MRFVGEFADQDLEMSVIFGWGWNVRVQKCGLQLVQIFVIFSDTIYPPLYKIYMIKIYDQCTNMWLQHLHYIENKTHNIAG